MRTSRSSRAVLRAGRGSARVLVCPPSKLRSPRAHLELVPREALVPTLLGSTEPLVLVSAPAGSGKTVAITQWLRLESRPVIWLRLDCDDNNPLRLSGCLAEALDEALGVDPDVFRLLQAPHPPLSERILPSLAAAVAAAPPFVLVLDDAQLVHSLEAWAPVCLVLDNLPDGAQLVVASRSHPPLPLGRLRARGELREVRFADLAFDRDETLELLRRHEMREGGDRRGLGPDTAAALLAATEGWVTGLYLASLTAHGRSPDEWLPEVRGDQRAIADYLLGEVLERQPRDLQRFLLETSILDELTAPLCAAVTGRADAGAVLARLEHENLFVSVLDDREEHYRYHHLFADLLRNRLERSDRDAVARLHRAAAAWLDEHDDPHAAVDHWLTAGDLGSAATTAVNAASDEGASVHEADWVLRLFRRFTDGQLRSDLPLLLTAGWTLGLVCGSPAEQRRWGRAACRAQADDEPTGLGAVSNRSLQATLRAYLALDGISRMVEDAELAVRLERAGPGETQAASRYPRCRTDGGAWLMEALSALGLALYLAGRSTRAQRCLEEVLREGDDYDRHWSLSMLSLLMADRGRWDAAAEFDRRALAIAPDLGLELDTAYPQYSAHVLAHCLVLCHFEDAELSPFLARASLFIERMCPQADHLLLLAAVILGEISLQRGEVAQAGWWSARADEILARYEDAGMLRPRALRLKDALDRRVMAEPITPAEQRVLELLPTRLTVAHLADRLFLSQPTVKAHLRAIYRKLEVGTREKAVERARELGLLKR